MPLRLIKCWATGASDPTAGLSEFTASKQKNARTTKRPRKEAVLEVTLLHLELLAQLQLEVPSKRAAQICVVAEPGPVKFRISVKQIIDSRLEARIAGKFPSP